jgi:hypothetical protein
VDATLPPMECSVLGTWDVIERDPGCCGDDGSEPALHFGLPTTGSALPFWGSPPGGDPTDPKQVTMAGTYGIETPDGEPFGMILQPTSGMGCTQRAFFRLSFQAACTRMTLDRIFDNCTGSRWYVVGHTVLAKR